MKWGLLIEVAVIGGLAVSVSAQAQGRADPAYARDGQNLFLRDVLISESRDRVERRRSTCATGGAPRLVATTREAGFSTTPDVMELCVTVLSRLGRDGALGYLQDERGTTSAIRFDAGFVAAYQRREAMPANLPTMAALKPLAERCLAQAEPNTEHCFSAGYALGLRAAHGELPVVQ